MKDKAQILELCERVRNLYESEFGDFKRKVGAYLDRASEKISDREVLNTLKDLKFKVVYAPNGKIEGTRSLVVSDLSKLT